MGGGVFAGRQPVIPVDTAPDRPHEGLDLVATVGRGGWNPFIRQMVDNEAAGGEHIPPPGLILDRALNRELK